MAIDPHGSLTQLRGVGPQAAQSLAKLGLNSPMDLLLHCRFATKIARRSVQSRTFSLVPKR